MTPILTMILFSLILILEIQWLVREHSIHPICFHPYWSYVDVSYINVYY